MSTYDIIIEKPELFKDYFLNDETEPLKYFPKFNIINIIVGANNSGKSRFLRNIMSLNYFSGISDHKVILGFIEEYNLNVNLFNENVLEEFIKNNSRLTNRTFINGIDKNKEKANAFSNNILKEISFESYEEIIKIIRGNIARLSQLERYEAFNFYINNFDKIKERDFKKYENIKRCYIPTLRTAHSLFQITKFGTEKSLEEPGTNDYEKVEDDIYLHTYLKNYRIDKSVEIFTGLHLYREILNSRNSKRNTRIKFEKFQDFIGDNFFDKKRIDIVAEFKKEYNLSGKNDNEIISIDIEREDKSRDLHDLGDGIQALIILMYKIFMAESDSFIFIDEPELNLHPGMQRLFLEQITINQDLKKKNLTYIITTHSNHFLDLTIEKNNVSIYSFSPKKIINGENQFIIKNVNAGDNQLLKHLGVNNSSVFMANCSIWVEGISDRNYIKAFLKSYCISISKPYPKEDIDFAFFEYAGSNIDHYIFENEIEKEDKELIISDIKALALSNKIFLIADSDATKLTTKKGKRLKTLEEAKSDNLIPKIIWDYREIENILTNDIWKEVLIEFCNKTLIKDNEILIQQKIEEALSEIDCKVYSKEYIGKFLEEIRNKMGKISSTYLLNQSMYEVKIDSFGTIKNKRELSEIVFNKNFSWEVFSKNKEIESLTIEIYNFILQK
ncbi:MAG: AAA family ATPase [Bacteroidota bacterium]